MKTFLILCSIFLTGCTALNAVDMLLPDKPGTTIDTSLSVDNADGNIEKNIKTNVQIGDKSADSINGSKAGKDKIDGDKIINYTNDWRMIVLLIVGWCLPSPTEMWRGFLRTCKSFGNFILKLCGKNIMK